MNKSKRPRILSTARVRKIFKFWQKSYLSSYRKDLEDFDPHQVWIGIQLASLFLRRDPEGLSDAWASPAENAIALIRHALRCLEAYTDLKNHLSTEEREHCDRLAEKLDWALDRTYHDITCGMHARRFRTKSTDLLLDALGHEIGNGPEAVAMLRHIQKNFPEVERLEDGTLDSETTISRFAWDVHYRVAALDRLVDEFPEHLRSVARQMNAWPVLRHRHTSGDARFKAVAENLTLGADYPLDTRKAARFRPDSPMVRYLDALIPRLNFVRSCCRRHNLNTERDVVHWWNVEQPAASDERPLSKVAVAALQRLKDLPPLTKSTAIRWANAVVVPLSLTIDANGAGPYAERAFEQVRRQRDIKSRAMFESRLESKVLKTLRSLARPD